MALEAVSARVHLQNLRCHDEGDGTGSAEPYLWTVFFKIDGETVAVKLLGGRARLQGAATVVGTPGNQGSLPNDDVDDGENVGIPAAIGLYQTVLQPIRVADFDTPVTGGFVGVVTILMEEDNTPNSAIAKGHNALNQAIQKALDGLIAKLDSQLSNLPLSDLLKKPDQTKDQILALIKTELGSMTGQVGSAVKSAIKSDVSVWEWLGGLGNMDDQIGSEVKYYSQEQLVAGAQPISLRWKNEGDWELTGSASATLLPRWSGWVPLGAPPAGFSGDPAAISRNPSVCNVYVRGGDNALWQNAYFDGSWHGWGRHDDGGVLASAPALDSMGPDHEHVFVRGGDNQVWQKWWTASGGWSGWVAHGAPPVGFVGDPAVVSRNPSVCNVYVRGGDNALWQNAYFDGSWHGWGRHDDGGVLASAPALGSMAPDHEHVFVRGGDNQVWQKWWTGSGGWSGWVPHGAPPVSFVGDPAIISRNNTVCNIYVRGGDNALWQNAYYDGGWHGWGRHDDGGVLASAPAPDSMGPGHEHAFVRGTDGQVWAKWWQ